MCPHHLCSPLNIHPAFISTSALCDSSFSSTSAMKALTVSLLVWAMVSQARAEEQSRLVQRSTPCPAGWTEIGGRCFCYVPAQLTWSQSEKNCQRKDANLASVHNANEYYEIQKMIAHATHSFGRTWLGGTDCQEEGVWLWTDGTPFDYRHCGKFDNRWWRQHCLQMNYGTNKCWDDVQCSQKHPSVCVKRSPR
ncbi:type-2 ice-structuring protein-like [Parambassis ranga]|uniref:Type-2 ice-structuring protein-like n=1 Tax=Parambassis ranga TaxID=210632 RepID=A0A6P7I325_9TELE|nr:type-2 ice-structuring protein-like [Parambassis ranga]